MELGRITVIPDAHRTGELYLYRALRMVPEWRRARPFRPRQPKTTWVSCPHELVRKQMRITNLGC